MWRLRLDSHKLTSESPPFEYPKPEYIDEGFKYLAVIIDEEERPKKFVRFEIASNVSTLIPMST